MEKKFEVHLLPDLLPVYYGRLFPYEQYYKWLSYGNVPKNYFPHREFSFTLADDIYLRYQSFKDKEEMEKEIQKVCPYKIDVGAVFSFRPKDHRTVTAFVPLEKEVVFDIDMTDYDEVRYCCSGAAICLLCWKYMAVAVEILDIGLREDFGFNHILWVFSGRRGVHGWVCDARARSLSQQARSAVAEYLQVVRGGENQTKKVIFNSSDLHPFIKKASSIISRHFKSICLEDQDSLGSEEKWNKILSLIPDVELRENLSKVMPQCCNSLQRWETIKNEIEGWKNKKKSFTHLTTEIMFQLIYPRLDINVSKGINHLLKSPFSIHPKTGREEIGEFDKTRTGEAVKITDYKKTSMKSSIFVFEKFLSGLSKENAARRLEEN
ncbi:DNA primase small subunit, partial [Armadillidium vulgare]